jgi:sulfur carrier protein
LTHTLKINGVEKEFTAEVLPGTVAELLDHMKIKQATVVAEIDGVIVNRDDFRDTQIKPGQSIELVRFVGGG